MAASPEWKVYTSDGRYVAACKEIEAAAALMGFYGEGATIRHEHKLVLWTEGVNGNGANSYDTVAEHAFKVLAQHHNERHVGGARTFGVK